MRAKVVSFDKAGLVLKPRWRAQFTVAYGEILTAERLRARRGFRLHTRANDEVRVSGSPYLESKLRERGVRVVDCWGAMITPTLSDFERALAEHPAPVRQSSDNA
jgi:hypothetical protein